MVLLLQDLLYSNLKISQPPNLSSLVGGNIVLGCPNTIPGRGAWMCRVKELTVSSVVEQWSDGGKASCRRGSGGEVNEKAATRL